MYASVSEHRMPYDIDGTEVGYRYLTDVSLGTLFGNGISSWLTQTEKQNLNREDRAQTWGATDNGPGFGFWFFFPELREVTKLGLQFPSVPISSLSEVLIQGSNDTTNGMDGTWETAVYSFPTPTADLDNWRDSIFAVSFSSSIKALRFGLRRGGYAYTVRLCATHIYGRKAAGQQPDDIVFCDASGSELTSLEDWLDRPEGTTLIKSLKVKNVSTKTANSINLQLNHSDFALSLSQDGPWQSVLDIASLGAGAISSTIYVRNLLGPPLLTLGPKAARIIASVGSWT